MRLSQIREGTESTLVYHTSASIWPLHNLVFKHKIKSVVGTATPVLSVSRDLTSALEDWSFGPYMLEIKTQLQPGRSIASEYRILPGDEWRPTRWALNLGYDGEPELRWLPLLELRAFDHRQYDELILERCAQSVATHAVAVLGECWARDFWDGQWPALDQLLTAARERNPYAGSSLADFRQLPAQLRQRNWVHDHRAGLYGHAVPKWSPLRPFDQRQPHWTEEL